MITEAEFAEELQRIMSVGVTKYEKRDMPINLDRFLESYKKKAGYELFCKILRESHNEWVNRKYPEIMNEINRKQSKGR